MSDQAFVQVPPNVPEQLREQLRTALVTRNAAYILGAQLVPLINQSLPEGWTYRQFFPAGGAPGLRAFVEKWLTDLVLPTSRKQGADFFYEVIVLGTEPAPGPNSDGELWRTFVAVRPSRKLAYDAGEGALKCLPLDATVSQPMVVIASLSLEEHKEMCSNFAARLAQDGKGVPALDELLGSYTAETYTQWLRVLRQHRPLDKEWGLFRLNHILLSFGRRLVELEVDVDQIEGLKQQLRADHAAAAQAKEPEGFRGTQGGVEDGGMTERRVRELLRAAIDRCSYAELREIRLPLGLVIDTLNSQR